MSPLLAPDPEPDPYEGLSPLLMPSDVFATRLAAMAQGRWSEPEDWKQNPRRHNYPIRTYVCDEGVGLCNEDSVMEALRRFPTPFRSGMAPAQTGDVHYIPPLGSVRITVDEASKRLMNETLEGRHFLHPGRVVRSVHRDGGRLYIDTHGFGTGPLPELNDWLAPYVWGQVDRGIGEQMDPTPWIFP